MSMGSLQIIWRDFNAKRRTGILCVELAIHIKFYLSLKL